MTSNLRARVRCKSTTLHDLAAVQADRKRILSRDHAR